MAKSKKQLVEDYVEIGGKREDFPEDLDQTNAADILQAIEDQKDKNAAEKSQEKTEGENKDAENTGRDGDDTDASNKKSENDDVVIFTLTKSNRFSTARIPGKTFEAGVPYATTKPSEIEYLRNSGRFKEE